MNELTFEKKKKILLSDMEKSNIKILNTEDSLNLIKSGKSIARLGDGELDIIKRRKKYYLNFDFKQCMNMSYILYGVEYDILTYTPHQKEYGASEIKKIIEEIYSKVGLNMSMLKIDVY